MKKAISVLLLSLFVTVALSALPATARATEGYRYDEFMHYVFVYEDPDDLYQRQPIQAEFAGDWAYVLISVNLPSFLHPSEVMAVNLTGGPPAESIALTSEGDTSGLCLAIRGNLAFLTWIQSYMGSPPDQFHFRSFDISDPTSWNQIGSYTFGEGEGGEFFDVTSNHAYIADTDSEMRVFSISDPADLDPVYQFSTNGIGRKVVVSDDEQLLFFLSDDVHFYSLANPAQPTLISEIGTGPGVQDFVHHGDYLVLAETDEIHVVDISMPAFPTIVGSLTVSPGGSIASVAGGPENIYVTGTSGLTEIIDITDPANPQSAATVANTGSAGGAPLTVAGRGDHFLATNDHGFFIYDVDDLQPATWLGIESLTGWIAALDRLDAESFVAVGNPGLRVISVANPVAPETVGSLWIDAVPSDVEVAGSYAYIITSDWGFFTIDLSNPFAPDMVGWLAGAGLQLDVQGHYAFVARGDDGLRVIRKSIANDPYLYGYTSGPYDEVLGVAVEGNYVYTVQREPGTEADEYWLVVMNVSDPSDPIPVGDHTRLPPSSKATLHGQEILVYGMGHLTALDIQSPTSPVITSQVTLPGSADGIAANADRIYVADGDRGMQVMGLLCDACPSLIGSASLAEHAVDAIVLQDRVCVATDQGSVAVGRLDQGAGDTACTSMGYEYYYMDLDTGDILEEWSYPPDEYDFRFTYHSGTPNHIRLIQEPPRLIAFMHHLPYPEATWSHVQSALFTPLILDNPLDFDDTVFIITDLGEYYKVGLAVEVDFEVAFCYERLFEPTLVPDVETGASFRLAQNFPNPFNPRTTISYSLDRKAEVDLSIYDLAGRLVRRLLEGASQGEGRHRVVWDGADDGGGSVASGVYVYRLEAGDRVEMKRMILIR